MQIIFWVSHHLQHTPQLKGRYFAVKTDLNAVVSISTDAAYHERKRKGQPTVLFISQFCVPHSDIRKTVIKLVSFLRTSSTQQNRLLQKKSSLQLMQIKMAYSLSAVVDGWAKARCEHDVELQEMKQFFFFLENQKNHNAIEFAQFCEDERQMDVVAFLDYIIPKWPQFKIERQEQLCVIWQQLCRYSRASWTFSECGSKGTVHISSNETI